MGNLVFLKWNPIQKQIKPNERSTHSLKSNITLGTYGKESKGFVLTFSWEVSLCNKLSPPHPLTFNRLYFFEQFTDKWNGGYRNVPHTPALTCAWSPKLSPRIRGNNDEATQTRHHHPKSVICTRSSSWSPTFYGFWQTHNGTCLLL